MELQEKIAFVENNRKGVFGTDNDHVDLINKLKATKTFLDNLDTTYSKDLNRVDLGSITVNSSCGLTVAFNNGYPVCFYYNGRHWNSEVIDKIIQRGYILNDYEKVFAEMTDGVTISDLELDYAITKALVNYDNNTNAMKQEIEEEEDFE